MLIRLAKFLIILIPSLSSYLVIKRILNLNTKFFCWRTILSLLLLAFLSYLLFDGEYCSINPFISIILLIVINKIIFREDFTKTSFSVLIFFFLLFVSELICSIGFIFFVDAYTVRHNVVCMFFSNLSVSICTVTLSYIKCVIKPIQRTLDKIDSYNNLLDYLIILILISTFNILVLINVDNFTFGKSFIAIIVVTSILIFLTCYLINEKIKLKEFRNKYENLFEYVKDLENIVNENRVINHEYYNQLSTIKDLSNNKKVSKYIDNLLKNNYYELSNYLEELNKAPSGGIKGLLYFKTGLALKNNIDVSLFISEKVKQHFSFSEKDLYNLTRVIGILYDNAIEYLISSKTKSLTIELYELNKKCIFVISNSIDKSFSITNLTNKGYSSKGKGRGMGLYFAKQITLKENNILLSSSIKNDYFIQRIEFIS